MSQTPATNIKKWQMFFYAFTNNAWKGVAFTKSTPVPQNLKLLTYNIWFDDYYMDERIIGLQNIIKQELPDIICMQEVIRYSFDKLVASSVIRDNYHVNMDPTAKVIPPIAAYGCAIFVKKTLVPSDAFLFDFQSNMGRHLMCVEFGGTTIVGTVHLESLNMANTRAQQMQVCEAKLKKYSNAVLCGDFNFDATRNWDIKVKPLENDVMKQVLVEYTDVWAALRPSEIGWTFDTSTNSNILEHKPEQMRYDRIMVKNSGSWKATSIEMCGNKPIDDKELKEVMPSDHYGLIAKFNTQ